MFVVFVSLLLMYVEPDGPGYEIELRGEIGMSLPPPHLLQPNRGMLLLSNKHFLSWGGVSIGRGV